MVFQQPPVLLELFTPDEVQAELEFTPGIKAGQAAILFIAFQMTDEIVRQLFRVEPGDGGEAHQGRYTHGPARPAVGRGSLSAKEYHAAISCIFEGIFSGEPTARCRRWQELRTGE